VEILKSSLRIRFQIRHLAPIIVLGADRA